MGGVSYFIKNFSVFYQLLLVIITISSYHKAIEEAFCLFPLKGAVSSNQQVAHSYNLKFNPYNIGYEDCILQPNFGFNQSNHEPFLEICDVRYYGHEIQEKFAVDKLKITSKVYENLGFNRSTFSFDFIHQKVYNRISIEFHNAYNNTQFYSTEYITGLGLHVDERSPCRDFNCDSIDITYTMFEKSCGVSKEGYKAYVVLALVLSALLFVGYASTITSSRMKLLVCTILHSLNQSPPILDYCNPIDRKRKVLKEGDEFLMFGESDNLPIEETAVFFKDNGFKLYLKGQSLGVIVDDDVKEEILLSSTQLANIGKFIFYLNIDNKYWPTNGSDHYIGTAEFIEEVKKGSCLNLFIAKKEIAVENYRINDLLKKSEGMSVKMIEILVRHNRDFFNCERDDVLLKTLNNHTSWTHRPNDVGNSQWKRYVSDVSNLLFMNGLKSIKTQYKVNKPLTKTAKKAVTYVEENIVKIKQEEKNVMKRVVLDCKIGEDYYNQALKEKKVIFRDRPDLDYMARESGVKAKEMFPKLAVAVEFDKDPKNSYFRDGPDIDEVIQEVKTYADAVVAKELEYKNCVVGLKGRDLKIAKSEISWERKRNNPNFDSLFETFLFDNFQNYCIKKRMAATLKDSSVEVKKTLDITDEWTNIIFLKRRPKKYVTKKVTINDEVKISNRYDELMKLDKEIYADVIEVPPVQKVIGKLKTSGKKTGAKIVSAIKESVFKSKNLGDDMGIALSSFNSGSMNRINRTGRIKVENPDGSLFMHEKFQGKLTSHQRHIKDYVTNWFHSSSKWFNKPNRVSGNIEVKMPPIKLPHDDEEKYKEFCDQVIKAVHPGNFV